MIKSSIGGEISIKGALPQIAVELEDVLRSTRIAFCDAIGEKDGNALLEECIRNSKLSEEEVARKGAEATKRMLDVDPERAASIETEIDELIEEIFGKDEE